jgi:uroporphyrinogen decarboxylase
MILRMQDNHVTRRERVMNAIDFKPVDRMPKDLGAMASTSISCFAYPKLRRVLGLPEQLPRVYDTGQMLALPEVDVLDALDCDVVTIGVDRYTNAFDEPERWFPYDFNGRIPSLVMDPGSFEVMNDGSIVQNGQSRMVEGSYVFDAPHGGQAFDMTADLPYEDLGQLAANLESSIITDEAVESIGAYCRKVRGKTDRAIMYSGFHIGLGYRHGIPAWSMMCVSDPDYVKKLHELVSDNAVKNFSRLLPAIAESVDIIMTNSDDQGLQTGTILPPGLFGELYTPYYRKVNDAISATAPQVRTFLHCCGAVYDIIDEIIKCGFDILNPVQWSAGSQGYREWKDAARGKIALWGGGVNTQSTLPLGSVSDVSAEVREVTAYLGEDSGYIFNGIHNLLAEIPPEKIIAMYEAAGA